MKLRILSLLSVALILLLQVIASKVSASNTQHYQPTLQSEKNSVLMNIVQPSISAGFDFTCLLNSDSSIFCWGDSEFGETNVPEPNIDFVQVSSGYNHACGLKKNGSIVCWGDNWFGLTPDEPNSGYVQVDAGFLHTCALREDGSAACWGYNDYGQADLPEPNSGFVQVGAGYEFSCGLKADGSVTCWGDGQGGDYFLAQSSIGYSQISLGQNRSCGLRIDGSIACNGYNNNGEAESPDPNGNLVEISSGGSHNCALKADSSVICWGYGTYERLVVPLPNSGFVHLSAGGGHTCAERRDGSFVCWGWNDSEQVSPISLSPSDLSKGTYGKIYHQSLAAAGGPLEQTTFTFDVLEGVLPVGITLTPDGTLIGSPIETGNFEFTVRARDEVNYVGVIRYYLTIDKAIAVVKLRPFENPYPVGQPIPLVVEVSSEVGEVPTGQVLIRVGSLPEMVVDLDGGKAVILRSDLFAGTYTVEAEYFGSEHYVGSYSDEETLVVKNLLFIPQIWN